MNNALFFISLIAMAMTLSIEASVDAVLKEKSAYKGVYGSEKIQLIEVDGYQSVILRLLEWVQHNPQGVISLPLGKKAQPFVEAFYNLKQNWNNPAIQSLLKKAGLSNSFPSMKGLKFAQMVEVGDQLPYRQYINQVYLPLLGLKKEQILYMDPNNLSEYDQQLEKLDGIGFLMDEVGVEGDFAFLNENSQPNTHLAKMTHAQRALTAVSLGGIKNTPQFATTISYNALSKKQGSIVLFMAQGEDKAEIVRDIIEGNKTPSKPVSILQDNPNVTVYATRDTMTKLSDRRAETLMTKSISLYDIDEILVEISLKNKKPIRKLTQFDIANDRLGAILLSKLGMSISGITEASAHRIETKIRRGLDHPTGKRILHTGPHHDDIMLGYYGFLPTLLNYNANLFVHLTSGFNAVQDDYFLHLLRLIVQEDYDEFEALEAPYALILARTLRAAREKNQHQQDKYESMILMRHIALLYKENMIDDVKKRVKALIKAYPLNKTTEHVQKLKGSIRESEEDRHMTIHGVPLKDVIHLRAEFYANQKQSYTKKDLEAIVEMLRTYKPDYVTVTMDPKGTGPETHYKVLELVLDAVKQSGQNPKIWGYRNVWSSYSVPQADLIIPVGSEMLAEMDECFRNCYTTQKNADFPPLKYQGRFSAYSAETQRNYLEIVKTVLGHEFFAKNKDERLRNADGLIFMREFQIN